MEDLKFEPYGLNPEYEYGEVTISYMQKEALMETAKKLKLSLPTNDKEQYRLVQATQLIDGLTNDGWECYEVVTEPKFEEIRRFRRKKSTSL